MALTRQVELDRPLPDWFTGAAVTGATQVQ
jgi:hypothetical protein